jgi:hypothetical protein
LEQYEVRERQFQVETNRRELELQISASLLSEKVQMATEFQTELLSEQQKVTTLCDTEVELRDQLQHCSERFAQVENALGRSNELFHRFRSEMEQARLLCPTILYR